MPCHAMPSIRGDALECLHILTYWRASKACYWHSASLLQACRPLGLVTRGAKDLIGVASGVKMETGATTSHHRGYSCVLL